jgi:hypothetical protein
MRFHDLFQRQKIRDKSFRMSFPTVDAKPYSLFSKYAAGAEYRKVCRHLYELQTYNPEITEHLLDFETEGRWLCLQNWTSQSPFPGYITSTLAFELQADYAMFRIFGFGE